MFGKIDLLQSFGKTAEAEDTKSSWVGSMWQERPRSNLASQTQRVYVSLKIKDSAQFLDISICLTILMKGRGRS